LRKLFENRVTHEQHGAAVVEMVLVLPLLLVLLLGMLDFGRVYNYWIDETHLANEAARYAVVDKNPGPGGTLQESVRGEADTAELREGGTAAVPNPVEVCIDFPNGSSNVGDPVRVTVTATYNFMSFLTGRTGVASKEIRATSTMRLERPPSNYEAGCA
jgi:Flp pilus assembly protein TadG